MSLVDSCLACNRVELFHCYDDDGGGGDAYSLQKAQARRNETDIGGLKQGASEASKNGGPWTCPWEMFHDHAL